MKDVGKNVRFDFPTINLWFDANGFVKFLENLPHYLEKALENVCMDEEKGYPVGHLDDDIKIRLRHYHTAADAFIYIGKGTYIAANVGIITANHDLNDLTKAAPGKDVRLGENCWIGMNSTILPGVTLGEHTIVGAGSVVTKSFPEGHCVIAGNPAKIIRLLEHKKEN